MRFFIALIMAMVIAPMAMAQSYQFKAGDTLRVEVLEDSSLNRNTLVLPDGRISLPLAGTVQASGRTIEQVQADITQKLAPNFAAAPTVFVGLASVGTPRSSGGGSRQIDVYVMGEVANPGKHEIDSGTSVLQFFAEMGGFSKFAATKRVQLRRGGQVQTINYRDLERGGALQGSGVLSDGDVIIVPQRRLFE